MGYVKNLHTYLDILKKYTLDTVDPNRLNDFIDNEIANNSILYYDKNGILTKDEAQARYKIVKTGLKDNKTEKDLYGSFERTSATRWNGVYIGTIDFLISSMHSKKNNYRMGLMFFDDKTLADSFINELHSMLLPGEKWSFTRKNGSKYDNKTPFPILESYIKNVYIKLIKDHLTGSNANKGKLVISSDERYLLFNTGLLNTYVEEVCVVGELVKQKSPGALWICKNPVVAKNKRELVSQYSFSSSSIQEWPQMVSFFKDIDEVIFKADINKIDMDYDKLKHIIEDRIGRFPDEYKRLYEQKNIQTIADDLKQAINNSIMMAKRNYKYIVPQYRPTKGKIQFLMPIYLKRQFEALPNFALVFDKDGDFYVPETILELDDAYNNARLIAKPDDLWLNPDRIVSSNDKDSDDELDEEIVDNQVT